MRHMLLILITLDNPFVFGLVLVFSIVLFFAILILVVKIWTERSQDKYTAMARDRKKYPGYGDYHGDLDGGLCGLYGGACGRW